MPGKTRKENKKIFRTMGTKPRNLSSRNSNTSIPISSSLSMLLRAYVLVLFTKIIVFKKISVDLLKDLRTYLSIPAHKRNVN